MSTQVRKYSLTSVVSFLEKFAPKQLAESWDNTGLLLQPQTENPVEAVLLTNDLTEDVTKEAVLLPAQLIISYHPPIFKPLTKITTSNWQERVVGICLENRIALYSPHTRWDALPNKGVNDWLLSPFDTEEREPISKGDSDAGPGRICSLKQPITIRKAGEEIQKLTGVSDINVALARNTNLDSVIIKRIAVCAGSGGSLLANVPADLYITGEMSHHQVLNAVQSGISVILTQHSNSERGYLTKFASILLQEFPGLNVQVSKTDRDPIQFFRP